MGSVYLCEHETIGWKAAVKILHSEFASNKEVVARFKREAKTLSELKHPNIVEILDFGMLDDKPFLIMEYMQGIPLDEYIATKTGPISTEDSIAIMKQVLSAMQEAHNKGVVHRDIKPSNIIIDDNKHVKILDFGIAKKLGNDDFTKTRMGQKLGTLPYMSPEQIKGLASISYETDIYSLGVLLHQMITGKPPYASDLTEYDISKNVVEYPLPRVKEIYPGASDYFQVIIDKATAKKIVNRYKSCDEFKLALENKKQGVEKPILKATPNNMVSNKDKAAVSKRTPLKTILIIILAIGLVIATIVIISQKEEKVPLDPQVPDTQVIEQQKPVYEPDNTNYGIISGSSVMMRTGPGTNYKAMGSIKHKGEQVKILEKRRDNSSSTAIVRYSSISVYDENGVEHVLKKGKAVTIKESNGQNCRVSFKDKRGHRFYTTLECDVLENMNKYWYKIKRSKNGNIGWIYGDFVKTN
jgi:serine/threonine protein kinase